MSCSRVFSRRIRCGAGYDQARESASPDHDWKRSSCQSATAQSTASNSVSKPRTVCRLPSLATTSTLNPGWRRCRRHRWTSHSLPTTNVHGGARVSSHDRNSIRVRHTDGVAVGQHRRDEAAHGPAARAAPNCDRKLPGDRRCCAAAARADGGTPISSETSVISVAHVSGALGVMRSVSTNTKICIQLTDWLIATVLPRVRGKLEFYNGYGRVYWLLEKNNRRGARRLRLVEKE